MKKIKTSRKIRKEIHRMSKLFKYTKEQEENYLYGCVMNFGMTPKEYMNHLKANMYDSLVAYLYAQNVDRSLLEKSTFSDELLKQKQKVEAQFKKDEENIAKGLPLEEIKQKEFTGKESQFISKKKMARALAPNNPKLWGNRNW